MVTLEQEIATYNAKLTTLLDHFGKFVLIKGEEVVDIYDTYGDAMKQGYERFKLEPFLVKRIMPAEQVLFVSRSIVPCQPSACQ